MEACVTQEGQQEAKRIKGSRIMIDLKIDGRLLKARKGESVLQVCQRAGIYIPTLCYQKELSPYGGCRLCLVEVKGWSKPVTSCTLPVQSGMVVTTDTDRLKKLRRFSLQLILSEHPHGCLICDRTDDCAKYQECIQKMPVTFGCKFCSQNGTCELQKLAEYLDVKDIPFEFSYRNLEVERHDPFFDRDYNLCVLCGRCVRACQELRGAGVLDFHHRGPETLVGTAYNLPHLEIGCQFCGACVDVCPTGALRNRYGKWLGVPDRSVKTRCLLCSLGCSLNANVRDGSVINTTPDNNQLCVRGRFGIVPLLHHKERVTVPLQKRNGRLVQITWSEALDFASSELNSRKGRTGILFSSQMTVEALDRLGHLARHLKCKSFSTAVPLYGTERAFDIRKFKKNAVFIIVDTDMIADFSPLLMILKRRLRHSKFIVIDPVATQFAQEADLWLRPAAGKELDVLAQIASKRRKGIAGISGEDILQAIELVERGSPYVMYNQANIPDIGIIKGMTMIPLGSSINILKASTMGTTATMADVLGDSKVQCLYLIGTAPPLPKRYGSIIVQDCFLPDHDFDLFLPTANFIETAGSIILVDGKKKRLRKVIEASGKSRSDEWIFSEIGKMMGIKTGGGSLKKPGKRAVKVARSRTVSSRFPLMLIVRENCYVYRNASLSQLLTGFRRLRPDSSAWIAPATARRYELRDGTAVLLKGSSIRLETTIHITDKVPENSVLMYFPAMARGIKSQPVRIESAISIPTPTKKRKPGARESGSE